MKTTTTVSYVDSEGRPVAPPIVDLSIIVEAALVEIRGQEQSAYIARRTFELGDIDMESLVKAILKAAK